MIRTGWGHLRRLLLCSTQHPSGALAGMMAKHIISIYDMCFSDRKTFELAVWEEKITDSLNYLFLLKAGDKGGIGTSTRLKQKF